MQSMRSYSMDWSILRVITISLLLMVSSSLASRADIILQPIQFSHKTHSQTYKISCEFCHSYASRSAKAGIPTLDNCLACHQIIKGQTLDQQLEIEKLQQGWFLKEPVVWQRIYDLPDFVYFSHRGHNLADITCQRCHGEIQTMESLQVSPQMADLSMGWCLECHQYPYDRSKQQPLLEFKTQLPDETNRILFPKTECLTCHQ